MEPIQTFDEVLQHLENNRIIMFFSPLPTYCTNKDNTIEIINKKSRLHMSLFDFIDLYSEEAFYLYEIKEDDDIDSDKDSDYYGLRYQ